jgi:hypothetical protein
MTPSPPVQRWTGMRTARLALAMCAALPAATSLVTVAQDTAPDTGLGARQTLTPLDGADGVTTAAIGQPVEWRVQALGGALARGDDESKRKGELDALGWRLIDGPTYLDPATRLWVLLALDPGVRTTPELQVVLATGGVAVAAPASLEVRSELAPGEDEPRPAKGFRSVPDTEVVSPTLVAGALAALALAAIVVLVLSRWKRPVAAPPAGPTPAERIAALADEPDSSRLVSALGPIVRSAVDAAHGADRAAFTDNEWAREVRARLAPASGGDGPADSLGARLAALVLGSGEVRVSGRVPSVLSAREMLDEAQSLLREVGIARPSPPGGRSPRGGAA